MMNCRHMPYIAIYTFMVLLFWSCKEKKIESKKLRPLAYQEVNYYGGETDRTFSGTARTDKIIDLSFRSSGILTNMNLTVGQSVKKGQMLGTLDNVQARLNYENAISSKNSAESQMNTAKLNLNRIRSLYEIGSASLSDYESAKNSYETSRASFESAKRSVAIQQEQIQYGYLYAPANGILSEVSVEKDENINAGQTVAVLNAGVDMEIALGLPESIINKIYKGEEVSITFSSIEATSFKGVITEVSPSVNLKTSTYPVTIEVINPTGAIKSGMAANVTFVFERKTINDKTIVLPAKTIGEDENGNFVFIVDEREDGAIYVKRKSVEVGQLTSSGFEIKEGLKGGEKIATAGLLTLIDGQKVKLLTTD